VKALSRSDIANWKALGATLSRRQFLGGAMATGLATQLRSQSSRIIEQAASFDAGAGGSLNDIEHFVFLMQENRSFDHYFGTYSTTRGFSDPYVLPQIKNGKKYSVFEQFGYAPGVGPTSEGYLQPFHANTLDPNVDAICLGDPIHEWGPQHRCWNGGKMDNWLPVHLASDNATHGTIVMAYYTADDIPVHHALADHFTLCDNYHCSVLGPTYPNRLYWMTGTIDPDGKNGGPLLETFDQLPTQFSWRTYPEVLEEAGVSWKVYQGPDAEQDLDTSLQIDNPLRYFKQYLDPLSPLNQKGLTPLYPGTFEYDVATDNLPQVSWVVPTYQESEHPSYPSAWGAYAIADVLRTLASNPGIWEKTAFILSYDENGGFFDHVPPPVAPPGTPGEYVTVPLGNVAQSAGIAGPIGLGFRVPCLVISPYSVGGLYAWDTFDHTSQLRLLETRFGLEVPNLSAWRRQTVGDMTSAFNFAAPPSPAFPNLPPVSLVNPTVLADVAIDAETNQFNQGRPYPVPPNSMPKQDALPVRQRSSGPV
jgi:phospholipase C